MLKISGLQGIILYLYSVHKISVLRGFIKWLIMEEYTIFCLWILKNAIFLGVRELSRLIWSRDRELVDFIAFST